MTYKIELFHSELIKLKKILNDNPCVETMEILKQIEGIEGEENGQT